jgi:hypothetical protein
MAINLDTRLPLAAIGNPLNPADVMQNARANAIQQKLDEMRMDYESRKRRRETDTERYMGEAINAIRQGRPAQTVTDFQWNTPNQTGVPQSPYEVSAREIAPAVPGRQPTLEDMQAASIDAMFKAGDIQGAFEAMKAAKGDGQNYGNSLVTAVDDSGNLVLLQPGGPTGARQISGFRPAEGINVVNTGDERVILGSRTGREQRRMPVRVDPTTIYSQGEQTRRAILQPQLEVEAAGKKARATEIGRAEGERFVERGQQVEKAENAIDELQSLKSALSKLPSPARLAIEGPKAFFGLGNKEIQSAIGEVERISGRMLAYVERLPGAATDADRQIFMASAGVITDKNAPAERKIAAADSAIKSYQRLIQKYGGKDKPEQSRQVNILPPASQLKGKVAKDNTTGIRYRSDGKNWVRIP